MKNLLHRCGGRGEAGLVLLTALYAAGGYALAVAHDAESHFSALIYSSAVGLATFFIALAFFCGRVFYIMAVHRPRRLTAFIIQDIRQWLFGHDRLLRAVPVFFCFMVFMSVFTSLKTMIPLVMPFSWDETFAAWDRGLHGGVDPWRLLHPVLGHPPATMAVNFAYNIWFFVMFAVLYWQLFAVRDRVLRLQFFFSFFLCWIIVGTVLAMLLSSAGPCFYAQVTGDDYYAPLMNYLRGAAQTVPVWALRTQDMLWQSYSDGGVALGAGISAMPSMHTSVVTILALTGWRSGNRAVAVALTVFAALIVISSVHLAWHYAIDAYVAIIVTLLVWKCSGWLAARLSP